MTVIIKNELNWIIIIIIIIKIILIILLLFVIHIFAGVLANISINKSCNVNNSIFTTVLNLANNDKTNITYKQ